ncbi:response regulator [Candidatus Magnetaquicoccus inordinatus]|uniref:response regulator n=1 Tax=Candidatus Magnetaquicoccus inordinatus TaxID=2496818 RepID=UPI00187D4CAF|nr:response regulator [Candidatus Magnetaquicoccus inordinatus]
MTAQRPTLLIVDDAADNIHLLSEWLEQSYRVLTARSGAEALRLLQETHPDLILLDVQMPDMDGFETCRKLKANPDTATIPVIFITASRKMENELRGLELGAVDFLTKPISPPVLLMRVRNHLALASHNRYIEQLVEERTSSLQEAQLALRSAMNNLLVIQVTPGVFWLQVPEAGLYILCGCPGEVIKHLMRKGLVSTAQRHGVTFETGPNAILLSDLLVQNGGFANLSEFPVLQMLYRQGMILPKHPNNTGIKPLLIGSPDQVRAQLEYIHRGNYGLISEEELMAAGASEERAALLMKIKRKFAFGQIRTPQEFLDTLELADKPVAIRNGVSVERIAFNRFRFHYRDESTDIDLNLPPTILYEACYPLGRHRIQQHYFAVLHTGEGDGWDINRPSMGSIVTFQGRIYLVDTSPTILQILTSLGIDVSEVEGIFQTHGHDDHFGGLPSLIHSGHRLKYYATPLVRASIAKKFAALTSLAEDKFGEFFELHDLKEDEWNDCDGLEVLPLHTPHPVEATIFYFRALAGDGYRTYAHLADLVSFEVWNRMGSDLPGDLVAKVRDDYLLPADLKKLDVGGGMVHGVAEDFRHDSSKRLVLAHIGRKLTIPEMEIGSESFFGAIDILIEGQQDYLRQRAYRFINRLFPQVKVDQIHMLLNSPTINYNAGTIIYRTGNGGKPEYVEMVLTGAVSYLDAELGVHSHMPFGSLMGAQELLSDAPQSKATYRAVSHCSVIRFPAALFKAFLENNGLLEHLHAVMDKVDFLRRTRLFGEQTTFRLVQLAQQLDRVALQAGEALPESEGEQLWLLVSGQVELSDHRGVVVDTVKPTGFFGEESYLNVQRRSRWQVKAICGSDLFRLNRPDIIQIPVVHWKMLEEHDNRCKQCHNHTP